MEDVPKNYTKCNSFTWKPYNMYNSKWKLYPKEKKSNTIPILIASSLATAAVILLG